MSLRNKKAVQIERKTLRNATGHIEGKSLRNATDHIEGKQAATITQTASEGSIRISSSRIIFTFSVYPSITHITTHHSTG